MELRKYKLVVEDFIMNRHPQSEQLEFFIEAHTAADAIVIGGLRHDFPMAHTEYQPHLHTRKLRNVVPIA